jgi:hypothetical protein
MNIFRHRRGMLFVSPIRARVFSHQSTGVSASINAILETVASASGINRKVLAEHLAPVGTEPAELEKARLALASDLHWLVSEGYVIEFNDGSLDLPKTKPVVAAESEQKPAGGRRNAPEESAPRVQPAEELQPAVASEINPAEQAAEARSVEERPAETAVSVPDETVAAPSVVGDEPAHAVPEEPAATITAVETSGAQTAPLYPLRCAKRRE